jgi:hypothetical protein
VLNNVRTKRKKIPPKNIKKKSISYKTIKMLKEDKEDPLMWLEPGGGGGGWLRRTQVGIF